MPAINANGGGSVRGYKLSAPAPRPGPAPRPALPPILPPPPPLTGAHTVYGQSHNQPVGSAPANYRPPAGATFSPAGIPPSAAASRAASQSMTGLINAIARGTGTTKNPFAIAPTKVKVPNAHLWDVNPLSVGGWKIGQADMGVDANAPVGAPILAPNNAVVTHIDPNWYQGQPQVTMRLTSGPNKGSYLYLAEQISNIPQVGQTVKRGQPIARYAPSGTGIEMGIAADAQGTTLAAAHGNSAYAVRHAPGGTPEGQQFISTFIKHGVKPGKVPTGSPPPSSGGTMNNVAVVNGAPLSPSQKVFAGELSKRTGMDPGVVAAWVHSEQPPTGLAPNGPHNWLNIGSTDSGFMGAQNPAWQNPKSAADFTARWLRGTPAPGFGTASSGIQSILRSAHSSPANQIAAIQGSGWASSGYPQLASAYSAIAGTARLGTANVTIPSGGSTGAVAAPAGVSGAPSTGGGSSASGAQMTPQQAAAAAVTQGVAGIGPFPSSGQSKQAQILSQFLKQQGGSSNPFNLSAKGLGAGSFSLPAGTSTNLGSIALDSLQRLAGVKLTMPGSRKKLI